MNEDYGRMVIVLGVVNSPFYRSLSKTGKVFADFSQDLSFCTSLTMTSLKTLSTASLEPGIEVSRFVLLKNGYHF